MLRKINQKTLYFISSKKTLKKFDFFSKIICIFSFIYCSTVFTSCTKSAREWQITSVEGATSCYCSSRLSLQPENIFTGLELDLYYTEEGIYGYLNSFGIAFTEESLSSDGHGEVTVQLKFEEEQITCKCFLLDGGYRIRLTDNLVSDILDALCDNKSVEINIQHCHTVLIPDRFKEHLDKIHLKSNIF